MSDLLEQELPGWRPDPSGRYEWRYWDGGWTNRVANSAPPASPDAPGGPPTDAPGGAPADRAGTPGGTAADVPAPPSAPPTSADAPVAAVVPAPPVAAAAPAAPAAVAASRQPSSVFTFPTRHDGSSGTAYDGPYVPDQPAGTAPVVAERRAGVVAAVGSFFRSFWEQEESYHSPHAGAQLPPHPKQSSLAPPPNYGRAGLVMLAACGVAIGAYLPWITYRVGGITQAFSGYRLGHATGFLVAAAAFAVAALLGARNRIMGWVTMAMSLVVAGLVARQLLDTHDQVTRFNARLAVDANVGIGLWVMIVAAAIGLIAAFRLETPKEIG